MNPLRAITHPRRFWRWWVNEFRKGWREGWERVEEAKAYRAGVERGLR